MSEAPTDDRTDTRAETRADTVDTGTMKTLSAIAALVGLWIAASPFIFEATETAMWNNVVVGLAILLLAGYNYNRLSNRRLANSGVSSLVAVLGLWALVSPFVFDMGSDELMWSTVVSGLLTALISGYNAYANRRATTTTGTAETAR